MWSDLIFGSRHHQHIWKGYCGHKVGASNSVRFDFQHGSMINPLAVQLSVRSRAVRIIGKKKKHFSKCPHRSEELLGKSGKMLVHKFPSGYLMMKVNTGLMVRNLYQSHAVSSHSIISLSLIYQKRLFLGVSVVPLIQHDAHKHTPKSGKQLHNSGKSSERPSESTWTTSTCGLEPDLQTLFMCVFIYSPDFQKSI